MCVVIEAPTVTGRSAGGAILLAESKTSGWGKKAIAWVPAIALTAAVGRLILQSEERVQGDPRGPGGPPYDLGRISSSSKVSGIGLANCPTSV
jgi:hypothetical protein